MQNYFYHERHEKEMTFYRNYFHTAYEIYYVREINTMEHIQWVERDLFMIIFDMS